MEMDGLISDNLIDQTMEKAMTQHNRKESQIQSIANDLTDAFGSEAAELIAPDLHNLQIQKNHEIKNIANHVMKTHKRKVSQFESLKQELGLVFDEQEAARIAKKTMKELNPNAENPQTIQIQNIVNKARKEHKRKVSQFEAIRHDIGQYIPNEQESLKLAADIMKEYNPNDKSGKHQEISIDSIVQKAVTEHKRKISVFRSVENDLGLIFDDKDVKNITKDVMKTIFAQKQQRIGDNGNRKRDSFEFKENDNQNADYVREMQETIEELRNEINEKDKMLKMMQNDINGLVKNKTNLVINSNHALDEMRGYLLQYQRTAFKIKS